MRTLSVLLLLWLLGAASCKKDDLRPNFIDTPSEDEISYVIQLNQELMVAAYSRYINNELTDNFVYEFQSDTIVRRFKMDAVGDTVQVSRYILNAEGYAEYNFDSIPESGDFDIFFATYDYENGFQVERDLRWTGPSGMGEVTLKRIIENENMTQFKVMTSSQWECSDNYAYNDQENKIDLTFGNELTGRKNKNLYYFISWNTGCPSGPSSSYATSQFTYELDENGWVTKRVELYTPTYHVTNPGDVYRTIRTTRYTYQFN